MGSPSSQGKSSSVGRASMSARISGSVIGSMKDNVSSERLMPFSLSQENLYYSYEKENKKARKIQPPGPSSFADCCQQIADQSRFMRYNFTAFSNTILRVTSSG